MKKILALGFAIALIGTLEAMNKPYQQSQKHSNQRSQKCEKSSVSSDNCCTPCCVPQPKKCIDCECYVPPYYTLQCDLGLYAYADFLYWYANESNLSYAMVVTGELFAGISAAAGIPLLRYDATSTKHIGTKWDPGFRVGFGWNSGYDGWDAEIDWTWYHNKKTSSISVPSEFSAFGVPDLPGVGQRAILNPWLGGGAIDNFTTGFTSLQFFLEDNVTATWKLYLNSIDAKLGHKFWLTRHFTLRPFAGARGAWAKTIFSNIGSFTSFLNLLTFASNDTFKDKFWGVGPVAGFQPEWHCSSCFSLFSNLGAALVWGQFKMVKSENYSGLVGGVSFASKNNFHSTFSKMQPILDVSFGLRWTDTWKCDRYRSYVDVSWEHHIWFDTNNRLKINSPAANVVFNEGMTELDSSYVYFNSYEEEVGNLSFGGLAVRAALDF